MIKLRQLISEKVIACGECVSWAWKYYVTNQHNKRAKVVFGSVQNKWTSKGKRFKHVWIVDGNKIKDWQTMVAGHNADYAFKGMPKRWFKDTWNPRKDKEYGMKQAADNFKRTKTMLGWKW